MKSIVPGFIAVTGLIGPLAACETTIPRPAPSVRPATTVTLPAAPELTARPFRMINADGSFTVEGLLRSRDKVLGDTVTVSGKVVKLVKCEAPPAPAPANPEEPQPIPEIPPTCTPTQHLVLADEGGNSKYQLTVYGTMRSMLGLAELNQPMTLTGHFDIVSTDGMMLRQAGLLLLDDIPVEPPAEPAPAPAPQ